MTGEGVDTRAAPFVTSFISRSPQGVPFCVVFHRRNSTVGHRVSRVLTLPVQLLRAGQPCVSGKSQVCSEVSNIH